MEHLQPANTARWSFKRASRVATRHQGFTLIEIMIALAIFALMMSIIFIPLNLGLKLFHIGKTRSDLLQVAQSTIDSIERELRKAVFVFPNEALPGVTDRAPYQINSLNTAGNPINRDGHPYLQLKAGASGVCDADDPAQAVFVDNPSRLDLLLPDNYLIQNPATGAGAEQTSPVSPLRPAPYLISYYPRRLDPNSIPEPFENPIVLFRAQMPYREQAGVGVVQDPKTTPTTVPPTLNVNLNSTRYPDPVAATSPCSQPTVANRGSYWLYQDERNEPNFENLTNPTTAQRFTLCFDSPGSANTPSVPGAHGAVLPRGVTLLARQAYTPAPGPPAPDYTPDTTFHCSDTDGDHKIDQVKITLVISSFDDLGADRRQGELQAQRQTLTQTVSLPNVR